MILQASQKLILKEKLKLGTRLKAEIITFEILKRAKRKRHVEKKIHKEGNLFPVP